MKPLHLTMTAFGPYKNKEEIDFTKLHEQGIFAISGATGAGKTTIFDAISFALYDSASGEDRSGKVDGLRSDFADDNLHTSVTLRFEMHSRVYEITRQLGHVKQGNKTKTGDKIELFEIKNGKPFLCTEKQNKRTIDPKIIEIIGLDADQFRQIVMLPQGEFRKLLTSNSLDKEEILRKIFATVRYQQIALHMNEHKKHKDALYRESKQELQYFMKQIPEALYARPASKLPDIATQEEINTNQLMLALQEELAFYQQQVQVAKNQYEQAEQAVVVAREQLEDGRKHNEQIANYMEAANAYEAVQQQASAIEVKRQQLALAKQAEQIRPYMEAYDEAQLAYQQAMQQLTTVQAQYATTNTLYQQSTETFTAVQKTLPQMEQLRTTIKDNEQQLPRLQSLAKCTADVKILTQQLTAQTQQLQAEEQKEQALQQQLTELQQCVAQLQQQVEVAPNYEFELAQLQQEQRKLTIYTNVKAKQQLFEAEVIACEQALHKAKERYEQVRAQRNQQRAAELATHLHDGETCPVCANTVIATQLATFPADFDLAYYETTKQTYEQAKDALVVAMSDVAHGKARIAELEEPQRDLQTIEILQAELVEGYVAHNASRKTLATQRAQIEELTEQLTQHQENVKRYKTSYEELQQAKQQEQIKATLLQQELGQKSEQQLMDVIAQDKQSLETLVTAYEQATQHHQQSTANYHKSEIALRVAEERTAHANSAMQVAQQKAQEAMQQAGFTDTVVYEQSVLAITLQQQLEQAIQAYDTAQHDLQKQLLTLANYKGQQAQDLTPLTLALQAAEQSAREAYKNMDVVAQFINVCTSLLTQLETLIKRIGTLEHERAQIAHLADALTGKNELNLSFERYVQTYYLQQIIEAANLRLRVLSNEQYQLVRTTELSDKRSQTGLDLSVYDAYADAQRDVKTLSGGEKFNASLSLALGVSDVIQSFNGNVQINTMFIDEGFGSLDEEALRRAITTLIELRNTGRTIAVISHVAELKEEMPAILHVTKMKEGYSTTAVTFA